MHPLQKQFQDFIENNHLLSPEDRIILAVSGGVDSMVLLDLFSQTDHSVAVAHCNYGLRGEESDLDEELVKRAADRMGIQCHIKKMNISGSIQLEARNLRYEWFDELAGKYGYSQICTAHHLNDSLETTIHNLVRGTGISGIKGIPVKTERVVRPLLFATREEILQYANERDIMWREDESNQQTDYRRNRIRLELIPKLEELNPSLLDTYKFTKERLELAADLLQDQIQNVRDQHFNSTTSELKLGWVSSKTDLLILSGILSTYGFNYATSREIFEAIGESGKIFPASRYTVYMDRSSLFIKKASQKATGQVVINGEGIYQLGGLSFKVEKHLWTAVEIDTRKNIALLDATSLSFPLVMRKWKEGDHFRPLGMKGSKKVSDFLIDEKVPHVLKDEVLVVEDQNRIIWLVGMRISEQCKIRENTREVIKIEKF